MNITNELFKTHYNSAILYLFSICNNKNIAEDIVCDCFFKALSTYSGSDSSFKFWLFRVCKNAYIDYVRKQKRQCKYSESLTDYSFVENIILKEEYVELYKAISQLNDEQKEIVYLFYFHDLSIFETAKIVGLQTNYVKVVLFRARQKLKKYLEEKI